MSSLNNVFRKLNERNKNTDLVLFAFQLSNLLKDLATENCTEKDLPSIEEAINKAGSLLSDLLNDRKGLNMSDEDIGGKIQSMKNNKDQKRLAGWLEPILEFKLYLTQLKEELTQPKKEVLNVNTQPKEEVLDAKSVKEIGGKSADLEELGQYINGLNDQIKSEDSTKEKLVEAVAIPNFTALRNSAVKDWLNGINFDETTTYLSKLDNLWKELTNEIQKNQDQRKLNEDSKKKLEEIQELLIKAFTDNQFVAYESFNGAVMVRSSTDNEDNKEHSQAGFYDSFPSENDQKSISSTIGKVIASYFNPAIFAIRLEQGENIKAMPGLSCLIQELIREDENSIPVSGVVYAKNDGTKIFYVKGHGEGAVGNYQEVKASTAFVTERGNVYCEVNQQNSRFVPVLRTIIDKKKLDIVQKKLDLVQKKNDFAQSTENHLPEEVISQIAKIAQKIRKERDMDMDIEFAVKKNADSGKYSIYLIQNRALTHEKNKQNPSTIDLAYFAADQNKKEIKGKLVTSSILTATIIKNSEEIIVCNTTAEADEKYVLAIKENKIIKAVIIKQPAVEGDHFANNFIARNVPIMNVIGEKFDEIQLWVNSMKVVAGSNNSNILVVDPQFQRIVKTNDKTIPIVEGLFKSPFSTKVSAKEVKEKDQKHWDIDLKALQEISSVGTDNQKNIVRSDLENMSFPQQGGDEQKESFARILRTTYNLRFKNKISQALYQKIVATVAELWTIKKEIEGSNQQDLEILKYLNIYQKLNGLFLNQEAFASSVINELKEAKRHKDITKQTDGAETRQINEEENVQRKEYEIPQEINDETQKEYYKELVTMTKLIARDDRKNDWIEFCRDVCATGKGKELASLVVYLVKYNLHQHWINTEFLKEFNENKNVENANSLTLFTKLQTQFLPDNIKQTRDLVEVGNSLDKMESKINDFSDPKKFGGLFNEFKEIITSLDKIFLEPNVEKTNLNLKLSINLQLRMIDIYDKAIKALQLSNEYKDKENNDEEKVANFGLMVGYFLDILERRIGKEKEKFQLTKEKLKSLCSGNSNNSIAHLAVSSDFALSSFLSNNNTEFERGIESAKTLADIHTALHQKLIGVVSKNQKTLLESAKENLPEEVKDFHKKMIKINKSGKLNIQHNSGEVSLTSIEYSDGSTKFSYNIPLREHSAIFNCEYDLKKKIFSVKMICSGIGNVEEKSRWMNLGYYFLTEVMNHPNANINILNLKTKRELSEIQLEFKKDAEKDVLEVFNSYLSETFKYIQDVEEYIHKANVKLSKGFIASIQNNSGEEISNWNRKWFLSNEERRNVISELDKFNIDDKDKKSNFLKNNINALIFLKNGLLTQEIINNSDLEGLKLLCSNMMFYLAANNLLDSVLKPRSINDLNNSELETIRNDFSTQVLLKKENYFTKSFQEFSQFMKLNYKDLFNRNQENLEEMFEIYSITSVDFSSFADLYDKDKDAFDFFIKNARAVKKLLDQKKCTFDELVDLYSEDSDKLGIILHNIHFLYERPFLYESPLSTNINLETLKSFDSNEKLEAFLYNFEGVVQFLNDNTLDLLTKLDKDKFKMFVENARSVSTILKSKNVDFSNLSNLYDENREKFETFVENSYKLSILLKSNKISFADLSNLYDKEREKFKTFVKNAGSIDIILTCSDINFLNNLYDTDRNKFEAFVEAKKIDNLEILVKSKKVSFDDLSKLYDQGEKKFKIFSDNSYEVKTLLEVEKINFDNLSDLYDKNDEKLDLFIKNAQIVKSLLYLDKFSFSDFCNIDKEFIEIIINNKRDIEDLLSSDKINLGELKNLYDDSDKEKFGMFSKNNTYGVCALLKETIDFAYLSNLYNEDKDKFKMFVEKADNVSAILRCSNIEFLNNLYDENREKFETFVKHSFDLEILVKSKKVSFTDLSNLHDHENSRFEMFVKKPIQIGSLLVSQKISFKDLIEIEDKEELEMFIENETGIKILLDSDKISSFDELHNLYTTDKEELKTMLTQNQNRKSYSSDLYNMGGDEEYSPLSGMPATRLQSFRSFRSLSLLSNGSLTHGD